MFFFTFNSAELTLGSISAGQVQVYFELIEFTITFIEDRVSNALQFVRENFQRIYSFVFITW